jgi:hypothetical protein
VIGKEAYYDDGHFIQWELQDREGEGATCLEL